MTKEKLKEEAEDIVYGMEYDTYESDGHSDFTVEDILVKFTEPREKRITELEAQIEKMKCCQNCMHYRHFTKDTTECAMSFITAQNCRHNSFDKWRMKENE